MFPYNVQIDIITLLWCMFALYTTLPYQVYEVCSSSGIWQYILVRVLFLVWQYSFKLNPHVIIETPGYIFTLCLPNLLLWCILIAWGCYELFVVNCVETLNHTYLYATLEIFVCTDLILCGIIIGVLLFDRDSYYTTIPDVEQGTPTVTSTHT